MPIALSFGILALSGGSASDVSLVLGVQLAPTIAFMIFGGVAGDRFKRNQIVGGSDIIGCLFVFLSAASFIFGFTSIALLCFTGFFRCFKCFLVAGIFGDASRNSSKRAVTKRKRD